MVGGTRYTDPVYAPDLRELINNILGTYLVLFLVA